jgi:hypothetical protein
MCNSLERFDTTMTNDPAVEARSLVQVRGGGLAGSGSVIDQEIDTAKEGSKEDTNNWRGRYIASERKRMTYSRVGRYNQRGHK